MKYSQAIKTEERQLTTKVLMIAQKEEIYEQRFDLDALDKWFQFKQKDTLPNGKVIQIVRDKESSIVLDGKAIFTGLIISNTLLEYKLFLTTGDKESPTVSVIDFPCVTERTDLQARELIRGDSNTNVRVERKSGKIWWNTKTSLVRENETIMTLPLQGDSYINYFTVEVDYILLWTRVLPTIIREDGKKIPICHLRLSPEVWSSPPAMPDRQLLLLQTPPPTAEG